jgi:hypothetical protein
MESSHGPGGGSSGYPVAEGASKPDLVELAGRTQTAGREVVAHRQMRSIAARRQAAIRRTSCRLGFLLLE